MQFKHQIELMIEENAKDFAISKAFKTYIKEHNNNLQVSFTQNQGKDFSVRQTKTYDMLLSLMYKVVIRKMFGNFLPMSNNIPISLIALGSYGREQLSVYSDIDLMIAYVTIPGYNIEPIIEKLLYLAWDAGLKLGHRVHQVKELQEVAKEDITIKTSLIERRFITGSTFVWHGVQEQLAKIRAYHQKEFIFEKIDESQTRYKKFPSSMQPNIKEGIGGLRDAQLLFWILKALYNVDTIKQKGGELFSEDEYKEFRMNLEFLFRVRNSLHFIAKKKQDVLVLEYIPEVTHILGMKDDKTTIFRTMQALQNIHQFTSINVRKVVRPFLFNSCNIGTLRASRIDKNFYLYNGTAFCSFQTKPITINHLLTLLLKYNDQLKDFDPSMAYIVSKIKRTKTLQKSTYHLIRKLFHLSNLYPILLFLYESSLLEFLIHPLKHIIHLAQFDGYHSYPVDIHSLAAVQALENIKDPNVQTVYARLTDKEKALLKMVVLLHDAGKGRMQDHSEVGMKLFDVFARHLDLNEDDRETGRTLIRYHTAMSTIAFKEDIYHDTILLQFITMLKTEHKLDMLYILTYADINAVGKKIYNSHNAKLLYTLYMNTLDLFDRDELINEAQKRARKIRLLQKQDSFLALSKQEQKRILSIPSNTFFMKHSTQDILSIVSQAMVTDKFSYNIRTEQSLIIEIYRTIPLNLGYLLGKLSFLSVAEMEIFTLFEQVKFFRIYFADSVEAENIPIIQGYIEESFDMSKKVALEPPVITKKEIQIDCNYSKTFNKMSIDTKDQKGLLAFIVQIFDEEHINISNAKIHTIKKRARDMFLIERSEPFCSQQELIMKRLTNLKK